MAAAATVRCGASGQTFEVPPGHAGGTLPCPFCGQAHSAPATPRKAPEASEIVERLNAVPAVAAIVPQSPAITDVCSSALAAGKPSPGRPIVAIALAALTGAAGGLTLGLMLAMMLDSPTQQQMREEESHAAMLSELRREGETLRDAAGRLEGELAAVSADRDKVKRELERTSAAMLDAWLLKVDFERLERRFDRLTAVKFERVSGEGFSSRWESPWLIDGSREAKFYALGENRGLFEVGLVAPYERDLNRDVKPLVAAVLLLIEFFPDWPNERAQDWILRAFEAATRDREIARVENGIRFNFRLTGDGKNIQVYVTHG